MIKSKVIKYGDNVDTDVIIPARYLNITDKKELSRYAMADLDSGFLDKAKERRIICAGANFGCGSSREHAVTVLKENGIILIAAKSFSRIFYRNAINLGLPIIECDIDICDCDEISADLKKGEIINITKSIKAGFSPYPEFIQKIIGCGGILGFFKSL